MFWLSVKLAAAAIGIVLVLYGAYIDGQRQKARKQTPLHHRGR
jgi:hypothetical protein